ncbi:hypothetical protein LguiA_028570 [Lonicera macranthoides]
MLSSAAVLGSTTNPTSYTPFNVLDYGATGDGKTDDSQAFRKTWKAACDQAESDAPPSLVIPTNIVFFLNPVKFTGPCKSSKISVLLSGKIVAPKEKSAWEGVTVNSWLSFANVNGLTINGKGRIDGRGFVWWSQPCLSGNQQAIYVCVFQALIFNRCHDLKLSGLTHMNSPRVHIIFTACEGVIISNLFIIAPETSPNTDGINISGCTNVQIRNSRIETGDDCIAISGGSSYVNITGVMCGPGHGFSIGALGKGGYDAVEEIHVRNCTLKGTLTGVRIKSWQGGSGYARKISFERIMLVDVNNPIIIDQYYCPTQLNCQNYTSAIKVSDVTYRGILGTSKTDQVINLSCSETVACTNIVIDHVYIKTTDPARKAQAYCLNAHGSWGHARPAVTCLLP